MKTVCVFLACCLALALAIRTPEGDASLTKQMTECRKELNIPDPATLLPGAPIPSNPNASFGCLLFCIQKKQGLMNEDGTFNKDVIIAKIQREAPDRKEAYAKLLEVCEKTVKPVNGCKLAACIVPGGPN